MKAVSLFSGAMGFDLGLERAGFDLGGCIEASASAVDSIRTNRPDIPVICGDIARVPAGDALSRFSLDPGEVQVVCGGPPCQAFSTMGHRRGTEDARGRVIFEFVRFVRDIRPAFFVMENVRGLLSMKGDGDASRGGLFREIAGEFNDAGYAVDVFVVNSVNYGCAQTRERVIVIGNRLGLVTCFPEPTHGTEERPFATLRDALDGVSNDPLEVMDFSPRKKWYLSMIPMGGNWRSLPKNLQRESMGKAWHLKGGRSAYWRRLSWDVPAPTLVTMPNHTSTSLCHPSETRALSVAEYAAIQGFPGDWAFCGTTADKYRQIGNAVPVVLGEMAGRAVLDALARGEPRGPERPSVTETHLRPRVRVNRYFRAGSVFSNQDYGARAA